MILGQRSVALNLLQQSVSINQTLTNLTAVILHIESVSTVLQRQILIVVIFQIAINIACRLIDILLQSLGSHRDTQLISIRQTQRSHTRSVRTSHRRTTHMAVAVYDGAQHLCGRTTITHTNIGVIQITEEGVATRRRDINPSTVVGVVCGAVVSSDRSHSHYISVSSGILLHVALIVTLVTCSEEDQTTCHRTNLSLARFVHTGIIYEIFDRLFERRELRLIPVHRVGIAPTVLADYRTIVTTVGNCACSIVGTTTLTSVTHRCATHNQHTAIILRATCDTRNTLAVVVHRSNRTSHVRTVVSTRICCGVLHSIETLVRVEVETENIVGVTILVIINAVRTVQLCKVIPDVVSQILVVIVNYTIDNRNNNLIRPRALLPRGNNIHVSTLHSALDVSRAISLLPIGTAVL